MSTEIMRVFSILIFLSFLYGCSCKCKLFSNTARLRIIRSSDHKDLLFGPAKIYNPDSIKFYSLNGTDTVNHAHGLLNQGGIGYDSVIWVNFSSTPSIAYIRLNNNDIDTLEIGYFKTKCCGDTHHNVGKLSYNHSAFIEAGDYLISVLTK
jgi:hypothetical protein